MKKLLNHIFSFFNKEKEKATLPTKSKRFLQTELQEVRNQINQKKYDI